ncbi:MAG: AbgT family transporter, partial [Myxococcota bacterium]
MSGVPAPQQSAGGARLLDRIEQIGNALPHPATLFLIGAVAVLALSQLAASLEWSVEKSVTREVRVQLQGTDGAVLLDPESGEPRTRPVLDATTGEPLREVVRVPLHATGLLTSEGLYWALRTLVKNFVDFPPLGVVLVGMLGIGVAEKSGFIGTFLKA